MLSSKISFAGFVPSRTALKHSISKTCHQVFPLKVLSVYGEARRKWGEGDYRTSVKNVVHGKKTELRKRPPTFIICSPNLRKRLCVRSSLTVSDMTGPRETTIGLTSFRQGTIGVILALIHSASFEEYESEYRPIYDALHRKFKARVTTSKYLK